MGVSTWEGRNAWARVRGRACVRVRAGAGACAGEREKKMGPDRSYWVWVVGAGRGVDISGSMGARRIFYGNQHLLTGNFPATCETTAPEKHNSYALPGVDRNIFGVSPYRQELLPIDRTPCLAR